MEWVHIMKHGMRVVRSLCDEFGTVELLEQYGDYFKLRVLRQEKSIGFIFGLIEKPFLIFGVASFVNFSNILIGISCLLIDIAFV